MYIFLFSDKLNKSQCLMLAMGKKLKVTLVWFLFSNKFFFSKPFFVFDCSTNIPRGYQVDGLPCAQSFLGFFNNIVLSANINIYRFAHELIFSHLFLYRKNHSRNMPVPRVCQCKHFLLTIVIWTGVFQALK